MDCMKTGLRFALSEAPGETFHGDMYFSRTLQCFLIRGIAPGTTTEVPHILLNPIGDVHLVLYSTPVFAEWWAKWNTSKSEELIGTYCIIADSRF